MALPDFFKQRHGSAETWARGGASRSLAPGSYFINNTGYVGEIANFGVNFPRLLMYQVLWFFNSGPNGGPLLLHWVPSHDNSSIPGYSNWASGGAFVNGTGYRALGVSVPLIATLPSRASNNGPFVATGVFRLPAQYGAPLLFNASGGNTINNNSAGVSIVIAPLDTQAKDSQ